MRKIRAGSGLYRALYALLLLALFINFVIPAGDINDLEKYRLKGSVKSIMEIKYTLADKTKDARKEKILYQKYTMFDKEGYETNNLLYQDGDAYISSSFKFGADGKPVCREEFKPDGSLNLTVNFIYDTKGNITEADYNWTENYELGEICENSDYYFEVIQNDIFTKILNTYEYRGYCTEEKYIKEDGSTSFSFTYRYDPRGNMLESTYFRGNGHLSWITKYKYDRYDNLVESRLFKSNRIAVFSTYKQQYDDMGNWTERKEEREVHVNILTAGLERADMVTERIIEYY